MESKELNFKLIDSTYSPEEAREALMSLIADKIYFLNQKRFSIHEQYSGDVSHLEKRVAQLQVIQEEYAQKLKALDNDNLEIEVSCEVVLNVRKKSKVQAVELA